MVTTFLILVIYFGWFYWSKHVSLISAELFSGKETQPPQASRKSPLCGADPNQPSHIRKTLEFSVFVALIWSCFEGHDSGWEADLLTQQVEKSNEKQGICFCVITNGGLTCTARAQLLLPKYGSSHREMGSIPIYLSRISQEIFSGSFN